MIDWLFDWQWIRALTVPMHQGLTESRSVLHNLVSVQWRPVPLLKFQMAPKLKILMPSESKKGTQIYFFLSLKNPGKRTLQIPQQGPLWREIPVYRAFFISRNPHKNFSTFFLSKAIRKSAPPYSPKTPFHIPQKHPSMFPKCRASMEADIHFQSRNISFGFPVKEPSLQVSFTESLRDRCNVARALHISFKVPHVKGPLWRFPYPNPFLTYLPGHQ